VIEIHEKADYLKGDYIFAVDNGFLTMQPPPLLSHNIKVFARIPPEKKAFVIRQYKKQHN
jgi:magnesium-transporting ATPase (P-type)